MKPLFVISCPIDTYSGYGSRSRDLVKAIIETDKYDVKILPQRWGNTPWNFIKDHQQEWGFLKNYFLNQPQLPKQPEIWAQITVANEFQPIGKYNIGFTAGVETTVTPPEFIEGINRMDVTFVSSKHARTSIMESTAQEVDRQTNRVIREIKVTKPVEVLFEGVNIDVYKPLDTPCSLDIQIKEDFAYLFVGHWLPGDIGEDRKNVGLLIKAFYETFKNKSKKPALVLKTSMGGTSYMDREEILKRIAQIKSTVNSKNLPNVYLLHGEFTDQEMNELYNHSKIKAMVNLTKGEGFGRPLLEFTTVKKPLITTNWSGQLDFLNPEFTTLITGTLTDVHPSAANQFLLKEAKWFSPDPGHVGYFLKDVFENYKKYQEKAVRQAYKTKTEFSYEAMKNLIDERLTALIPEFPKEIKLQLPQLKKIELPKLKKI
jgi:hypothetical protein